MERGYAIERGNRLISTTLGYRVYNFLSLRFGDYTSEEATRKLESIMDKIERGEADYQGTLKDLYQEILKIREV